ncbi:hypothetical protein D9M72_560050 [compost metagenome]
MGITTAGRYVLDFIGWAEERGVGHPSQVSRTVLERYQRWLRHYRKKDGMPLSIAGQRCKLVPLRGFSKWLTRVGEIPANPAADLELQEASPPARVATLLIALDPPRTTNQRHWGVLVTLAFAS